ncbi:MAG: hypothetical protein PHD04_05260, partial [Candidatus Pacebacteria bacterium]|nr:hypothetical protein [Candidatus Paceibacterota bacterium]
KINSFTDVGQGGVLGILILFVTFGALTLMMKDKGGMERALSVSTFVTSIIGLFLRLLGLINDYVFYICIAMFIVAGIFLIKEASQYEQ